MIQELLTADSKKTESNRKRYRVYRAKNRDTINAQKRSRYYLNRDKRNPEKVKEFNLKTRLRKLGTNIEEWNNIFILQKGRCKVCKCVFTSGGKKRACTDHCHGKSGHIRALLCSNCNCAEGLLHEPKIVLALYNYMMENELLSYV